MSSGGQIGVSLDTLGLRFHAAPSVLHRAPLRARLHFALPRFAPAHRASDALHVRATWPSALLLVRPFIVGLRPHRSRFRVLRPLLTSRSGSAPSPFQAQGEISPGKNALLRGTTAGSTPRRLDHERFAVACPLALLGSAFYPVLVHRLAAYALRVLPTLGHPHAVALHFVRCDPLTAGLAPAGVRPCWAHTQKRRPGGALLFAGAGRLRWTGCVRHRRSSAASPRSPASASRAGHRPPG